MEGTALPANTPNASTQAHGRAGLYNSPPQLPDPVAGVAEQWHSACLKQVRAWNPRIVDPWLKFPVWSMWNKRFLQQVPHISKWMCSQISGLGSQLLAAGTWTHLVEGAGSRIWQTGPILPVQEQKENRPVLLFFLIISVLCLYWVGSCCSQLLRQPLSFQVRSLDVCWNGSEAEFHPNRIIISLKMQRCVIPGDYLLVLEIISLSYLFPQ